MSYSGERCGFVKPVASSFIWELSGKDLDIDEKECDNNDQFLLSPTFHAFNSNFHLRLDPKHLFENDNYVAIGLVCKHISNMELRCYISLLNIYNKKTNIKTMEVKFIVEEKLNGKRIRNYIKRSELISKRYSLFKNDKLKILCEIDVINIAHLLRSLEFINFDKLLNNEEFSDVKIDVNGRELYAHKVFLANKSDVFKAMFTHQMKEKLEESIQITDIDHDIVMEMLRFLYTGQVNDIDKVALRLIFAAEKYNIADLKLICSEYLVANLTVENVIEYIHIADQCNVDTLKTAGINFISSNAKEMAMSPEFKSIMELNEELVFEVMKLLALERK